MKVNPCSEEYFKESILKQFHIYKKVAEKVPDVKFVDSRKKIVEVYRDTAKYITEAQNKKWSFIWLKLQVFIKFINLWIPIDHKMVQIEVKNSKIEG